MAENFVRGAGATGLEEQTGERIGVRFRAPHGTPQPLLRKAHPAAGHNGRAARHAHGTARRKTARHQRATVVSGGNPAIVQLQDSDTSVSLALAQHVAAATVTAGGTVIAVIFDDANPADGLIIAAY